jgi:hypothetical protein
MRRAHIVESIDEALGFLPDCDKRVPLNVKTEAEASTGSTVASRISYQIDAGRRVTADLFIPAKARIGATSAIVCLFDPAHTDLARQVGQDLAAREYVCLVPRIANSGSSNTIADLTWQAMRAADVLQGLRPVHAERIGFVGDAVDGQLGMYVAAFDQRFLAAVVDASRARSFEAAKNAKQYSLSELLAATSPRAIMIASPANSELSGELQRQSTTAAAAFGLRRVPTNLRITAADGKSGLLGDSRDAAYTFLDGQLRRTGGFGGRRGGAN